MSWHFLSYELSENLSGYGDGKRIEITKTREIAKGATSNNSEIAMPVHFGTHMDFPYHFGEDGLRCSNYTASSFIFKNIIVVSIDCREIDDKIIEYEDLMPAITSYSNKLDGAEALIIKTGFCELRSVDRYWKNNPGFSPNLAKALKQSMPNLRLLGFDSISLTNYQNRELGRIAHKSFLLEQNILIVEDMMLDRLNGQSIRQLIVAPLRITGGDGAPVTVFAELV